MDRKVDRSLVGLLLLYIAILVIFEDMRRDREIILSRIYGYHRHSDAQSHILADLGCEVL